MVLLLTALFWVLKILGVWAVLGGAFAYAEYTLGRWAQMDQAAFKRRMFLYGPASWILNGGVWLFDRRFGSRTAKPGAK